MKKESSSPETCLVFVPIEFDLATFKTDEIVPDEKFGKEQLIQFFQTPFTVVIHLRLHLQQAAAKGTMSGNTEV